MGRPVNLLNSGTERMPWFQKCNKLIFLSFCVSEDILESVFPKDTNENTDTIEREINRKHQLCFVFYMTRFALKLVEICVHKVMIKTATFFVTHCI